MRIYLPLFALLLTAAAPPPDRFGETCTGSETISVGAQPPRTLPYALTFSADLANKRYCYGECGRDQSYAIAESATTPIKLADVDGGGQSRHILFDRAAQILTDDQSFDAGLGRIVRHARATCHAAPFVEPPVETPERAPAR